MSAVPSTVAAIQNAKKSTSGKTLSVQVGGSWFSTKNWEFENMIGQTISFVPDVSEWQGNTITWINDYVQPGMTSADAMNQAMASAAPAAGPSSAAPQPRPVANVEPIQCLPMTSNLVAHAIAAGLCKSPDQIEGWANAAFAAAKNCLAPRQAKPQAGANDFDDDIPF